MPDRTRPIGRFVDADGVRLHAVDRGSGPCVVLVHGNPGSVHHFLPGVVDGLSPSFRVIAIDRPGHGDSGRDGRGLGTPQAQARIVRAALHALGAERPILVAESWSGALALSYALDHPTEVAGIVTSAGTFYGDEGLLDPIYGLLLAPVAGTAVRHTVGPALSRRKVRHRLAAAYHPDPVDPEFVRRSESLWTSPRALFAVAEDAVQRARVLDELAGRYHELRVPLLMLAGTDDAYVDQRGQAYRLRDVVAGARVVDVPGAGHFICETRPEAVVAAVREVAAC